MVGAITLSSLFVYFKVKKMQNIMRGTTLKENWKNYVDENTKKVSLIKDNIKQAKIIPSKTGT